MRDWAAIACPDVEIITTTDPDVILDQAAELGDRIDYLLIDSPAGMAEPSRAIALVADVIVIPTGQSVMDLAATKRTTDLVKRVQRARRDGGPRACILLNGVQPNTRLFAEATETVPDFDLPVLGAVIRRRQAIMDSIGQGLAIWRMGYAARQAAQEIDAALKEVFAYGQEEADNITGGAVTTGDTVTGGAEDSRREGRTDEEHPKA